ncbi:hypothetical protein BKI52_19030 [marine bacterium AO1-C]|nr:hypothetical protein BKI52_19030 [marine bacterium AO1-C]
MSKDLNMIKNERIVYLMIITLLVLTLAYTILTNGNEGEKKRLLTENELVLRKEIVQLDKVIKDTENQVKELTTTNDKKKRELKSIIEQLKSLKSQKEDLLKNVQDLKRDRNINLRRITDLNEKIVKLRKNAEEVKKQQAISPRNQVDSSMLLVIEDLRNDNAKLESKNTYLSKKVTDLENKMSNSLPVHVEMEAQVQTRPKSKEIKQISITFLVLPNNARKQTNKDIQIFHLRYRYNKDKKDTEIERELITTLAYRKKKIKKDFVYKPKRQFEAGTHIFEAMANGEILGSKTLNITQ